MKRNYDPGRLGRTPGMKEALRALHAERRRPTADDAPPVSTFPMTRAARTALRLDREGASARVMPRG